MIVRKLERKIAGKRANMANIGKICANSVRRERVVGQENSGKRYCQHLDGHFRGGWLSQAG